ncbi:hypothetical protein ACFL1A_01730 [Patescibacteria group bacterium]
MNGENEAQQTVLPTDYLLSSYSAAADGSLVSDGGEPVFLHIIEDQPVGLLIDQGDDFIQNQGLPMAVYLDGYGKPLLIDDKPVQAVIDVNLDPVLADGKPMRVLPPGVDNPDGDFDAVRCVPKNDIATSYSDDGDLDALVDARKLDWEPDASEVVRHREFESDSLNMEGLSNHDQLLAKMFLDEFKTQFSAEGNPKNILFYVHGGQNAGSQSADLLAIRRADNKFIAIEAEQAASLFGLPDYSFKLGERSGGGSLPHTINELVLDKEQIQVGAISRIVSGEDKRIVKDNELIFLELNPEPGFDLTESELKTAQQFANAWVGWKENNGGYKERSLFVRKYKDGWELAIPDYRHSKQTAGYQQARIKLSTFLLAFGLDPRLLNPDKMGYWDMKPLLNKIEISGVAGEFDYVRRDDTKKGKNAPEIEIYSKLEPVEAVKVASDESSSGLPIGILFENRDSRTSSKREEDYSLGLVGEELFAEINDVDQNVIPDSKHENSSKESVQFNPEQVHTSRRGAAIRFIKSVLVPNPFSNGKNPGRAVLFEPSVGNHDLDSIVTHLENGDMFWISFGDLKAAIGEDIEPFDMSRSDEQDRLLSVINSLQHNGQTVERIFTHAEIHQATPTSTPKDSIKAINQMQFEKFKVAWESSKLPGIIYITNPHTGVDELCVEDSEVKSQDGSVSAGYLARIRIPTLRHFVSTFDHLPDPDGDTEEFLKAINSLEIGGKKRDFSKVKVVTKDEADIAMGLIRDNGVNMQDVAKPDSQPSRESPEVLDLGYPIELRKPRRRGRDYFTSFQSILFGTDGTGPDGVAKVRVEKSGEVKVEITGKSGQNAYLNDRQLRAMRLHADVFSPVLSAEMTVDDKDGLVRFLNSMVLGGKSVTQSFKQVEMVIEK